MTEIQTPPNEEPRFSPHQVAGRTVYTSDGSPLFLEDAPMPEWPGRALYCFTEPVPVGSFHNVNIDFISKEGCDATGPSGDPDGQCRDGA